MKFKIIIIKNYIQKIIAIKLISSSINSYFDKTFGYNGKNKTNKNKHKHVKI